MTYKVDIKQTAQEDLYRLAKNEPRAFEKAQKLIGELKEHPKTGTGHPEPLKGKPEGRWSRQISKKHRLVYRIYETEVVVLIIAAYGHYDDK
ncbi:MAG: Txe/YoeB family addiction module toxin [Paludibacteraceae bacterium]|nr:Txe/YoeB family addiction module toxin [Paludibacteraceae bacterium]